MKYGRDKVLPKSSIQNYVKNGKVKGIQRYLCKNCGYRFTVAKLGKRIEKRIVVIALQLYLEGLGFRAIERVLGVSHVSVMKWVKEYSFPLTLEFDQSLFVPNSCHDSTLLHWYSENSHPETGPYHLLRNFSSGTIVLPYMASFYEMDKKTYINCYSSSGGVVTDTVYVWKFIMTGYDDYRYLFITSVQDQTNAQMQAYIYPNPAQNEVKVTVGEPAWCYITDISGKTVQNTYVQAGTNSIELSTVPKGLYIMRLQGKNKFWQQKLIVE